MFVIYNDYVLFILCDTNKAVQDIFYFKFYL